MFNDKYQSSSIVTSILIPYFPLGFKIFKITVLNYEI